MDWFRVYNSIKDDPKILQFSPENRWFFVAILCVSSEQEERGTLPTSGLLAIALRVREAKMSTILRMFIEAGLIDEDKTTKQLTVHGWNKRQRKTDDVAARVNKHREATRKRFKEPDCNVTDVLPHACVTETDTETDTEYPPLPPTDVVLETETKQEAEPACTAEELARLRALAWEVLASLRFGDLWIGKCLKLAELWSVEYVEALIYRMGQKLKKSNGACPGDGYAVEVLRAWLSEGGPPDLSPKPILPRIKPMTDTQRKHARHAQLGFGPREKEDDDDGEDGSEEVGAAAAEQAHRPRENARRA